MKVFSTDYLFKKDGMPWLLPFMQYVSVNEEGGQVEQLCRSAAQTIDFRMSDFASYERRYGGQDANGKRIAVVRMCGIGDQLIVSAVIHYIKALYPRAIIHVYTVPSYASTVWQNHPDVSISEALPLPTTLQVMQSYDYHICYDGMQEMNVERNQNNCYDDMFEFAGLYDVPDCFKRPFIAALPSDDDYANKLGADLRKKHFVYVAHTSAPQRNYPWATHGKRVVEGLLERYPDANVYISTELKIEPPVDDPRCIVLGDMPNWRSIIPFLRTASAVITPDTGIGHLAACWPEIPVVSLWGSFSYECRALYYPNHHPLTAETCPHAPCYKHGVQLPVHLCKDCTTFDPQINACGAIVGITPEQVLEKVSELVPIKRMPPVEPPPPLEE